MGAECSHQPVHDGALCARHSGLGSVVRARMAPRGIGLVLANVLYALTDPPIRWFGRFVPPLRLGGGMSIDVGFMLLFLMLMIAQRFVRFLFFISQ